ncbi:MAG: hypothetical protein HYY37_03185 [Candidatus Aenigmarchaeota archaeon]|nr:hypothetical protein [Candidatus Aenigmarchaeota archaeon]
MAQVSYVLYRRACHAAFAVVLKEKILSTDLPLDTIGGVQRVDPGDLK